ncbi:MAG: hypothetical protein GY810_18165 [Aureispira sp.]|nr:hypothetical protein [Aureispira sp.]
MKKLVLLFIVMPLFAYTQIKQEARVEIELNNGYSSEKIHEFGEKGFLLQSLNEEVENGEREWNYQLYNTNLELSKEKNVKLPSKQFRSESFNDLDRNYTLFKDRKGNFSLVTVDAKDCNLTLVSGALPKKCRISQMAVLGDYAYFKSIIRNIPYLFSINWKTGQQKPILLSIHKVKPKHIDLSDFQLLEKTNEVMLYVHVRVDKRKQDTYILNLDDQGNKKESFNLTENIEESILGVSALNLEKDKYIFTGTYSSNNRFLSEGIYFCKAKGSNIDFINFHKFTDLNNFLSYLPEKRQERLKKKKEKKEKKGKEFKLSYRIAPHDIVVREDGYILIGEAYYTTTRTETYTTTSVVNGVTQTTTHTRQVFDGYRYTHAFIAKFGLDGTLLWDQTFEMWPTYKPFFVKKFISIDEWDENSLKLLFVSGGRIVTKTIDNTGKILNELKTEPIKTLYTGDKTKWTISNINHWYKNCFIAYGKQKIKNKDEKTPKKKRKVYFISKILFE